MNSIRKILLSYSINRSNRPFLRPDFALSTPGYKFALSPAFRNSLLNPDSTERVFVTRNDLGIWLKENICALGVNPLQTPILTNLKYFYDSTDESKKHPWGFTQPQSSDIYYIDFLAPKYDAQHEEAGQPILLIKRDILIIGTGLTSNDQNDFFARGADYYVSKPDLPAIFNGIVKQMQELFGIGRVNALLIDEGAAAITSFRERPSDENSTRPIPQSRTIPTAMTKIRSYSSSANLIIVGGSIGKAMTENIRQGIPLTSR